MPNLIRFPLYNSGVNLDTPRYCFVNVDGIFKLQSKIRAFGDGEEECGFEIIYEKDWGGLTSPDRYLSVQLYYKGPKAFVDLVDLPVETDRLRKIIKTSSAKPNSMPIFELLPNEVTRLKTYSAHIKYSFGSVWAPSA